MLPEKAIPFERKNTRFKINVNDRMLPGAGNPKNQDFTCRHCGRYVSADNRLAGVNHRNHCPYCLCSRHVDLWQPGDRLSACKAVMRPVGLTVKRSFKKYASPGSGEIMLVHRCADCSKISINRIAADDDEELIAQLNHDPDQLEPSVLEEYRLLGIEIKLINLSFLRETWRNSGRLRSAEERLESVSG